MTKNDENKSNRTPRWFTILTIVLLLPLLQIPFLLSMCQPESPSRTFIWIYPFYAILSAYFAMQCYPQRRAMAWILLLLLIMSHTAIWFLATTPI